MSHRVLSLWRQLSAVETFETMITVKPPVKKSVKIKRPNPTSLTAGWDIPSSNAPPPKNPNDLRNFPLL